MIEDIKNEYENIRNNITAEEYIEDFRETFNTIQDNNLNTNFLKELYYEFVIHTFKQTSAEKFLVNQLADIEELLMLKFNNTQKEQLKIYDYLHNELAEIQGFTSFVYGFCMANELNRTTDSYIKDDKILNEIINKLKTINSKGGEDIND